MRGAVGMGLAWAVGWALVGFGIELIHNVWPNSLGSLVDIWPAVLAYPAFFGGLAFSAVLGIAGRRRRFDELSLPRFSAWGAVAGVLLSLVPALLVAARVVHLGNPDASLWQLSAAMAGPLALLSAVSASGTLWLVRMADDRELLEASADEAEVGLSHGEAQELLGGRG
jgi:hypothetical protein